MKILVLLCSFVALQLSQGEPKLAEVRCLYFKSADEKAAAGKLYALLEPVDSSCTPVMVCYKGAAEMMRARYSLNPIHKYSAFKNGRSLIESAIKRDSTDIETRFIRFSIQSNLPEFLNYDQSLTKDKKMLIHGIPTVADTLLKKLMVNFLAGNKYVTKEELNQIR